MPVVACAGADEYDGAAGGAKSGKQRAGELCGGDDVELEGLAPLLLFGSLQWAFGGDGCRVDEAVDALNG